MVWTKCSVHAQSEGVQGALLALNTAFCWQSGRVCTLQGAIEPSSSRGVTFADTDGPDAVPATAILVTKTADFLHWAGMDIHLKNVTCIDMRNGQRVATDLITLPSNFSQSIAQAL